MAKAKANFDESIPSKNYRKANGGILAVLSVILSIALTAITIKLLYWIKIKVNGGGMKKESTIKNDAKSKATEQQNKLKILNQKSFRDWEWYKNEK